MEHAASPAVSEDDDAMSSRSWQANDAPSPSESKSLGNADHIGCDGSAIDAASAESGPATGPMQKRRRVTRACDECRRKKIKCDGKQPCTHCSVYSYECTYDKPSNRRRNPAPQYVEALEDRLQRAETLLRTFIPDFDLADPTLDPAVQQEFRSRELARRKAANQRSDEQLQQQQQPPPPPLPLPPSKLPTLRERQRSTDSPTDDDADGEHLKSMIETIGQLDLTETGEWNFHGISSGSVWLRRMKQQFQGLLRQDFAIPISGRPLRPLGVFSLDSPPPADSSPLDSSVPHFYKLPPKEQARSLCYLSLNCATCLFRIVHIPSFFKTFERLYENTPDTLGPNDHRDLSLFYSLLAIGCMYNISEDDDSRPSSYKEAIHEGLKYYLTSRLLLQDITGCRDLTSLQAFLFMILFLQATSNLTACYSFIGIALRAALRMGLHRNLPHAKLNPIERETRRRVFYVIRQMDTYVSALLGFPLLLRDEDIDQPLPTEVDDEYITKDAILTPPPNTPSFFQACNAYTCLMDIMAKVIKHVYPLKSLEDCVNDDIPNTTYMISYAKIKEIERDLHEWHEQLPVYWQPSHDGPVEVIRIRTLLRFSYAHVQMMVYRPFLHYVSPRVSAEKNVDERCYACAAAAISISRNIVHIGIELRKQAVLIGPYWFILFTEFFAILSLVYYCLENPEKLGSSEIMAEAVCGRNVIASLTQRSLAADRVTSALNTVFDQLSDSVKSGKKQPAPPTKKRSAPCPKVAQPDTAGVRPLASLAVQRSDLPDQITQRRLPLDVVQAQPQQAQQQQKQQQQQQQQNNYPARPCVTNYQDFLPMDMPSAADNPGSSEAPSIGHCPAANYQPQHAVTDTEITSVNSLYRLDAMMFPSTDPFAYPSQPPIDLKIESLDGDGSHGARQLGNPSTSDQQNTDAMQFFPPSLYGDIEGQLLGSLPAYMMPPSDGSDLGLASERYNAPSILTLQQNHAHTAQQQQREAHAQQQQQQQQQQRQFEAMFTDGSFSDIFPGPYPSM